MLEALGLSTVATVVYRSMLDHPSDGVAELAGRCDLTVGEVHGSLEELAQLMLVRVSSEFPGQMRAVSPEVGLADMIAREEADLAARQAQLAASRAAVTRLVAERADARATHGETVLGMDAIQARLEQMAAAAQTEVLGSQPGVQGPQDLEAARPGDHGILARGVVMRSLFREAARSHAHLANYGHWLLSQGGEVRTAPTIPQRMVIVDQVQALVPVDPADTRKGALHITEPGILAALVDLFEQAWGTAVPLGASRPEDPETGLSAKEQELLRLLGTGLTDDVAGQRLGISSRTVSRQMASIMERLDATSRFEAGIKAAQRGWL